MQNNFKNIREMKRKNLLKVTLMTVVAVMMFGLTSQAQTNKKDIDKWIINYLSDPCIATYNTAKGLIELSFDTDRFADVFEAVMKRQFDMDVTLKNIEIHDEQPTNSKYTPGLVATYIDNKTKERTVQAVTINKRTDKQGNVCYYTNE